MKKLIAIALILSACSTQHNGQWVMFGGEEERCFTNKETVCSDVFGYVKGLGKCTEGLPFVKLAYAEQARHSGFTKEQLAKAGYPVYDWHTKDATMRDKCMMELTKKHCQMVEVGYCKVEE